ncbi:MAG: glycosyltransferase [Bacteroidaceae bacterium]|nr:glycosyltransferase [Bacteroidaceae bacterium]
MTNRINKDVDISVVIPVYGAEKYLRECIDSIINQSFRRIGTIEIVLVDDESPDNCGEICEQYAKKYHDQNNLLIKVIHQKNKGINGTRRVGVANAVGEWIAFCDDDDSMTIDALEAMYAQSEGTDIVIGFPDSPIHKKPLNLEECRKSILGECKFPSTPWAKLFRREILTDDIFEFPREIDGEEDAIMNTRLLFKVNRAPHFVFKKIYNFRANPLSFSHKKRASFNHEYAFYKAQEAAIPNGLKENYMHAILRYKLNGIVGVAYSAPKSFKEGHSHLIQVRQEIKKSHYKTDLVDKIMLNVKSSLILKSVAFLWCVKNFLRYRLGLNN